jgi:hypothetical protein
MTPDHTLGWQCCFCGEGISSGESAADPLDPCAVVLIGNWLAPESHQLSQQFFCHLACFKRKITTPGYVEIDKMEPGDQA